MLARREPVCAFVLTAVAGIALAQAPDTFAARLSWVPISLAEQSVVSGRGEAIATLARSTLSINGRFEGLPVAATRAVLHRGVATGARGPAIAELEIVPATEGTFSGEVELDREQRAALLAGHLYIRLHGAVGVAPDNAVLRGWLLAGTERH